MLTVDVDYNQIDDILVENRYKNSHNSTDDYHQIDNILVKNRYKNCHKSTDDYNQIDNILVENRYKELSQLGQRLHPHRQYLGW